MEYTNFTISLEEVVCENLGWFERHRTGSDGGAS
jgi:hypothetical protein